MAIILINFLASDSWEQKMPMTVVRGLHCMTTYGDKADFQGVTIMVENQYMLNIKMFYNFSSKRFYRMFFLSLIDDLEHFVNFKWAYDNLDCNLDISYMFVLNLNMKYEPLYTVYKRTCAYRTHQSF